MKTFEETLSVLHSVGISLSNLMEGSVPPCWVAILRQPEHLDRVGRGDSPVSAISAALAVENITVSSYKEYRKKCAGGIVAPTRDVLADFMKKPN